MNDYILDQESAEIAKTIWNEILAENSDSLSNQEIFDLSQDKVHEAVDSHQWIIYTYKAHEICQNCNRENGEAFLEEVGPIRETTYDNLAITIAYGEMFYRVQNSLCDLFDTYEMEAA